MTVLSRFLPQVIPASCGEFHPWDSSCARSAFLFATDSIGHSLKLYLPLVLSRAMLTRRRVVLGDFVEIGRMCSFLGVTAGLFHVLICAVARLCGGYHIMSVAVPAFLASLVAIQIPHKSSGTSLALYCITVALNGAYSAAKFRGWLRPVKHGEVFLFAMAAAGLMLTYEEHREEAAAQPARRQRTDMMSSVLRFLLWDNTQGQGQVYPSQGHTFLARLHRYLPSALTGTPHFGVLCHSALVGLRGFSLGFLLQAAIQLVTLLPKLPRLPYPFNLASVVMAITRPYNVRFGAFVGAFLATYKLLYATLRGVRGHEDMWNGMLAGGVSALWMGIAPQPKLALYLAVRMLYAIAVKVLSRPNFLIAKTLGWSLHHGNSILYAAAVGFLCHLATFEPHNIPPAYWKYLVSFSGGRLKKTNRAILEPLGTQVTLIFQNWPPCWAA